MNEADKAKDFARRLRQAREQSGLSQDAVAKRLGLQRPAVSEIEAGRRQVKAHELSVLAELFHVSTEWLTSKEPVNSAKLEIAARKLAGLKPEDLDKILDLLQSLRPPSDPDQ